MSSVATPLQTPASEAIPKSRFDARPLALMAVLALAAWPLAIEPGVDITFPEPPLASYSYGRYLSRFNQPVDGPEIDLQVFQDLFGREEHFVCREI